MTACDLCEREVPAERLVFPWDPAWMADDGTRWCPECVADQGHAQQEARAS